MPRWSIDISSSSTSINRACIGRQIPGVAATRNIREQVDLLFYGIPPWGSDGLGWKWNPDRDAIDGIADRVGCTSMTHDEILRVVDTFVVSVAEAFLHGTSGSSAPSDCPE